MSTLKTGTRTNADGTVSVYLRYSNGRGASYRINTGVKVPGKAYRDKDGSWITDKVANHIALNQVIKNKIAEVDKFVAEYMRDHSGHSPSVDEMKEWHTKPKKNGEIGFTELWNEFIAEKRRDISVDRIRHYDVTYRKLMDFKPKITMSAINTDLVHDFRDYMADKGIKNNTINSNFTRFKTFLIWCKDYQKYDIPQIVITRIKVKWEERDIIFHPQSEITTLFEYASIVTGGLKNIAYSYLFQCLVGMRFSDLDETQWWIEDGFLKYVPRKTRKSTGKQVCVPLMPEAISILEYYSERNEPFPKFSMNYYNETIKIVGRDAGLTQNILLLKGRKQHEASEYVQKCELMSSHVARATFICLMANNNIPDRLICEMAGITQNTLKHYLSIMNDTLKSAMDSVTRKVGDLTVHVNKSKTA